jgi:nucleotide-binding universal stress UspA family protein
MTTTTHASRLEAGRRVFSRVLAGIDGSQQALEAARQAALLQDVDGRLTLFSSWDVRPLVAGGPRTLTRYEFEEQLERATAEKALVAAREYVASFSAPTGKLARGTPVAELLEEIDRDRHTLIAIGSSGTGRLRGIVEGAVATEVVHRAPCSVLVARQAGAEFPLRIVVGVDGSTESAAAYAAADYLAERFGAELRALVARGGKGANERLVATITGGDHENRREAPADALTEAAEAADLVIVGSRGLHGVRALGSVSEHVAHTASCSTLVVREPIWQRAAERVATERGSP